MNRLAVPKLLNQLRGVLCVLLFSLSLIGEGFAALSGSTEQIRQMVAERDFPGIEPAMDAQQQFIVFSPDRRLSRDLLDVALNLRRKIYRFFGISKVWDQPAFILVFPNEQRYGIPGTGGAAVLFKYRGQSVRMIGSYIQPGLSERILPHEIVHFLIADICTLGTGREGQHPDLPIFINEGIAEYFTASPGNRVLFEKTVWEGFQAGKLESLSEIVTSTASWIEGLGPGDRFWAQRAQGYSVISFLVSLRNGNAKLRNYLLNYGASVGRVPRESASLRAFQAAFRLDFSSWPELQNKWMQFIRDREVVTVEAESASVVDSSGEEWEVKSAPTNKLWLSGGKQILFHASKPGSFVILQSEFRSPGVFDVFAIYTQGSRTGQFQLALNGKQLPLIFEGYARKERVCEPVYCGKTSIGPGPVTARFSVTGKAAVSRGFRVGVDCLVFRRDRRLEQKNRAAARRHQQEGADSYRRRRFREAEASFTKALDLVPGDATALEWRAHARLALHHFEEAERDVEAAVKLSPGNARLRELKKRIEAAQKEPN